LAEKNKAFFAADKHKLRLCERRPKVLMRGTERRVMNLSFFDFWKMGFVDSTAFNHWVIESALCPHSFSSFKAFYTNALT
jgi:hypothetical protein